MMIMNDPLPGSAEADLSPEHTHPVFPSAQSVPVPVRCLEGLERKSTGPFREYHQSRARRVFLTCRRALRGCQGVGYLVQGIEPCGTSLASKPFPSRR